MNGFKATSDSYREMAAKGECTQEQAERICKAYDFLATCDQEDFCTLFNSTAFNGIAKAYLRKAVDELAKEGKLTAEQGKAVLGRLSVLFDEMTAQQALQ